MELQEIREKLSNIQNMSTDIQELTDQEVLATFRGNRPKAIVEAEGRIASLTRQSLNVDRITEYDKLLSIEAEIKELEMFITTETKRAIEERKPQMEQEQKASKEQEKETAIKEVTAEVEGTKSDIEAEMENTKRAIQDQLEARKKISTELISRKEITKILTEKLQIPTSSEEYKRASRSENDCVTKLRDIDERTKKLQKKLEGLEQDYSEIDSLLKECQELGKLQRSEEVKPPAVDEEEVVLDEGLKDEYGEEYRREQEQEEKATREKLEQQADKRIQEEQRKQEEEMWADYKKTDKQKQQEELVAWKEKFAQEAKEEKEIERRTKREINAYDRSLKNGIDNDNIKFDEEEQPATGKKPEGQQPVQQPTPPPVEKKPSPIIRGQKYTIAKTGLHIKDNGEPAYFAILVDEQGNEIIYESSKGFEDIVELDKKEAFNLREKDGIIDSRKYYDKGLANLLEEVDQMTGTTNTFKMYKDMLRDKFNKNADRKSWLPIEYDFSNLYVTPNDIEKKKKVEFVKKIANSSRLQKMVLYEKAPNIFKRVLAKLFPKIKEQKLIEAPKQEEQPDLAEQLAQIMPEGSLQETKKLTTIQEKVDYYKQARELPEFEIELFIQECDLTEEQAQKFRTIHEKYTEQRKQPKGQQVETIRDSYLQLRSFESFDIEQFISDYGITGEVAAIYRASHANYLKNQTFRDSLRDEDLIKKQQEETRRKRDREAEKARAREELCEKYRDLYQEGFDARKIKGITKKQVAIIQADWEEKREQFCERHRKFYNSKNFIQNLQNSRLTERGKETILADFKEYQRREFCEMYRDMYNQRNFDPSKLAGLTPEQVQMLQEDYERYRDEQRILANRQAKNRKKMAQLARKKGKGATFIGGRMGESER